MKMNYEYLYRYVGSGRQMRWNCMSETIPEILKYCGRVSTPFFSIRAAAISLALVSLWLT